MRFLGNTSLIKPRPRVRGIGCAMWSHSWEKGVGLASPILMRPIFFHDLKITFVDILGAHHDSDGTSEYHRHPWYEFNYISDGALYTRMEDTEFLVAAGECFLIPPGVMHSHRDYRHTGDYGFCVRWELERAGDSVPAGPARIAEEIMDACSSYQPRSLEFPAGKLFGEMEGASVYELELIFLKWFLEIVRVMNPDMTRTADRGKESRQNQVVQQVLLYLEEYSSLNIDIRQLAGSVGYSYRHLARLFKEKTGSTLVEKLNGIRIAKAIDLLENTDLKIAAICGEVGFHTETYFSRIFAEYTHLPPSLFRIAHRKKT